MQTIIKQTYGFFTRVKSGSLSNSDQLITFAILMSVMVLFVALKGHNHPYQGYYYDNK